MDPNRSDFLYSSDDEDPEIFGDLLPTINLEHGTIVLRDRNGDLLELQQPAVTNIPPVY